MMHHCNMHDHITHLGHDGRSSGNADIANLLAIFAGCARVFRCCRCHNEARCELLATLRTSADEAQILPGMSY